jgi:hypothetical protein
VLALPRRLRQLGAQHLGHVDLDDDLALEVPPRIEVEVLVRRPREAVVAHDPVGDEIARAGGDVVHRDLHPERFDLHHLQATLELETASLDRALAGDRRIHRVEEAEVLGQAAPHPNVHQSVRITRPFDDGVEAQATQRPGRPVDNRRVGARNADALTEVAFRVEAAGEEPLAPVVANRTRPLDNAPDRLDRGSALGPDGANLAAVHGSRRERKLARRDAGVGEESVGAPERLQVGEGKPEAMQA